MNSVSWFIYLTDILSRFTYAFTPLVPITFIFIIIPMAVCHFLYEENSDYKNGEYVRIKSFPLRHVSNLLRYIIPIWFIMLFAIILIPSKQTMYMIAASQVGEQVVQLEQVQDIGGEAGELAKDAIELLRQNIQEQLTEKPVEASKAD